MDHPAYKKPGALKTQFSTPVVNFAPNINSQSLKRDPRERAISERERMEMLLHTDRHDSLNIPNSQSFMDRQRRESATFMGHHPHGKVDPGSGMYTECRFAPQWRRLSSLQIFFGLLVLAISLYSHYPLFSCGWRLAPGADTLWFGTWIGALNLICGIFGIAASKNGMEYAAHKWLRRTYFIMNCSFVPFANGIGMGAFGIILSEYVHICNQSSIEQFTNVVAFTQIIILTACLILNILGIVYQVIATVRCKCWICDPKNANYRGLVARA